LQVAINPDSLLYKYFAKSQRALTESPHDVGLKPRKSLVLEKEEQVNFGTNTVVRTG
jgi:hypothetical protein